MACNSAESLRVKPMRIGQRTALYTKRRCIRKCVSAPPLAAEAALDKQHQRCQCYERRQYEKGEAIAS